MSQPGFVCQPALMVEKNKKVSENRQKIFSQDFGCAQHSKAGQNKQQMDF